MSAADLLGRLVAIQDAAPCSRGPFNLIDLATGWKADLIVRRARPCSELEMLRRQRDALLGADHEPNRRVEVLVDTRTVGSLRACIQKVDGTGNRPNLRFFGPAELTLQCNGEGADLQGCYSWFFKAR